jgi:hypothetical protein
LINHAIVIEALQLIQQPKENANVRLAEIDKKLYCP